MVRIVLPYTDGELSQVLDSVEEILLMVVDDADLQNSCLHGHDPRHDEMAHPCPVRMFPEDDELPPSLRDRAAADAVGRLALLVADFDRRDDIDVQPLAPGGFELVPLHFVRLSREDLSRIRTVLADLSAERDHPSVEEATTWSATSELEAAWQLAGVERLAALLQLPWDGDIDLLATALEPGPGREPVELSLAQYAAYERVTERIIKTWGGGSALERFLYRG